MDAKEKEFSRIFDGSPPADQDISGDEGGCPDIATFVPETEIALGGNTITVPKQLVRVIGRGCAVSSSSGDSLGLSAFEFDFTAQYEYLPWLFFRAGMTFGYAFPISYSLSIQYAGELDERGVKIQNGPIDPADSTPIASIAGGVRANSKARVRYSGYHLQIPLLVGINLYSDKDSAFYWAYGLTLSSASFKREVEGAQEITIETTEVPGGPGVTLRPDYEKVVNRDEIGIAPGLMTVMGARRRLSNEMFFFVEFRWHKGGSVDLKTTGTQKKPGVSYASDTASAAALEEIFEGSVAQPLRNPEAPGGGRVTNGLDLSYDMRMFFGVTYQLDY